MKNIIWILGFVLVFFSFGCDSEDELDNEMPVVESNKDYPSGSASYFTNNVFATAITARARFNGNDQLSIVFEDDQGKVLSIAIDDFIGESIYVHAEPETTTNFEIDYFFIHESQWTSYVEGSAESDTLIIDFYDETNGTISGEFDFNLQKGLINMNVSDGVFTDVPIVQLQEAEPGRANFFHNNRCNSTDSAWAELTNNFQLIIHFPHSIPNYSENDTPLLKTYVGLGNDEPWYLDYNNSSEIMYGYSSRVIDFQWNLDLDGGVVSGRAMFDDIYEFEVSFNQIPIIIYPIDMSDGLIDLHVGEEIIQFTEINYQFDPLTWTFEFEALNNDNQKFILHRLNNPNFEFNTQFLFPGLDVELQFFEDQNNQTPTWRKVGFFGDSGDRESGLVAVGFQSDTIAFRAMNIPIQQ